MSAGAVRASNAARFSVPSAIHGGAASHSPLARCLVLFAIACAGLARCATSEAPVKLEHNVYAMGTEFGIALYGPNATTLEGAAEQASEEGNAHRPDAVQLHSGQRAQQSKPGGLRPSRLRCRRNSSRSCEFAMRYSRESEGSFDITVGPFDEGLGLLKGYGPPAASS